MHRASKGVCTSGVSAGVEEGPAPEPLRRLSATPVSAFTMLLADTRPPCRREHLNLVKIKILTRSAAQETTSEK